MTPEAAGLLNEQMERSRFDSVKECRRRLASVVWWWLCRGRGLEEFFTLFGFVCGVTFRNGFGAGLASWFLDRFLGLVRRGVSRRVGFEHPGWLDSAMVAWFITGNEGFSKMLFEVASQPVEENTVNAGRIWKARYVLNSVRVRHPDLADQIAELELTSGRPLVPLGEMAAIHGPA